MAGEESLRTRFRASLWDPFVRAIERYGLIGAGDSVAVCVSGGKDSMLLAKLMQLYRPVSPVPFELRFLSMDPGYSPANRRQVEANAARLGIPLRIFGTDVFEVANRQLKNPCFLCAKMRRGHLYSEAQKLGCNKIALGHHFNDVIETTLMAMLYGAQLQAMPPRLTAANFEGMTLIRPLYLVREDDIIAWRDAEALTFLQCACRLTEDTADGSHDSKRAEVKRLIRRLREEDPEVERHIFDSLHRVDAGSFPRGGT